MGALKKQFKAVHIEGVKDDFIEVHATTVRGKDLAVLVVNDKVVKAINRRNDREDDLKEEQKTEILRKISMKEMFQEKQKDLYYFYKDSQKEELKAKKVPLYFISTFLRVPSRCNWSLFKWDVLVIKNNEIVNVTSLFKDMSMDREGSQLQYGSDLKEVLRRKGFTIAREL